jgi:hypothetical protein
MCWLKRDVRRQLEGLVNLRKQQMPIINLESVIRALPEVSLGVGLDPQAPGGCVEAPVCRFAAPAQARVKARGAKAFVELQCGHLE